MSSVFSIFIVLHGLVHFLYSGQSARLFELRPDMVWPDGSWIFSRLLGYHATRILASVSCTLVAIAFMVGGIGTLAGQVWWRPVVAASAAVSAVLIILFWDGKMVELADQGGIGLLIDLAILFMVLVIRWPN